MTRKTIKVFIKEIYSRGPQQNYRTNKTDVYPIDDIWSLDKLDLKDYCPENNRGYRYVLNIIDKFSKFGWATPLSNKNAQTIKDSFEDFLINSKRKPNVIETDRGKEIYSSIFPIFRNNNNIKLFSRSISYGAVFAERYNRSSRDLPKRTVFEKGDGNWIDL